MCLIFVCLKYLPGRELPQEKNVVSLRDAYLYNYYKRELFFIQCITEVNMLSLSNPNLDSFYLKRFFIEEK